METAPRSMRLQIAVAGRTNSGKSSFMNLIAGQDVAITSPVPGTTTDVVEKAMELRPLGPVLFLDTAGIDDETELGNRRIERSGRAFDRADVILLVTGAGVWGAPEERMLAVAKDHHVSLIPVVNKCDLAAPEPEFLAKLREATGFEPLCVSSNGGAAERERVLPLLKDVLLAGCPEDFLTPPPLLGDLVKPGDTVVLIVPVDIQAPKGRLILPQVQAIRDALDSDALCYVVKESAYQDALANLRLAGSRSPGAGNPAGCAVHDFLDSLCAAQRGYAGARGRGGTDSLAQTRRPGFHRRGVHASRER